MVAPIPSEWPPAIDLFSLTGLTTLGLQNGDLGWRCSNKVHIQIACNHKCCTRPARLFLSSLFQWYLRTWEIFQTQLYKLRVYIDGPSLKSPKRSGAYLLLEGIIYAHFCLDTYLRIHIASEFYQTPMFLLSYNKSTSIYIRTRRKTKR